MIPGKDVQTAGKKTGSIRCLRPNPLRNMRSIRSEIRCDLKSASVTERREKVFQLGFASSILGLCFPGQIQPAEWHLLREKRIVEYASSELGELGDVVEGAEHLAKYTDLENTEDPKMDASAQLVRMDALSGASCPRSEGRRL